MASERSDRIGSAGPVVTPLPTSDLDWSSCARFDVPEPDIVGTNGWECATLTAAMDPFDGGSEQTVELALTRHAATGDCRRRCCSTQVGPAERAAPCSAADMEAIRVALGERQLDYLGYSYGATLGAASADNAVADAQQSC